MISQFYQGQSISINQKLIQQEINQSPLVQTNPTINQKVSQTASLAMNQYLHVDKLTNYSQNFFNIKQAMHWVFVITSGLMIIIIGYAAMRRRFWHMMAFSGIAVGLLSFLPSQFKSNLINQLQSQIAVDKINTLIQNIYQTGINDTSVIGVGLIIIGIVSVIINWITKRAQKS